MRDIRFRGFHQTDDGDTTICVGGKEVRGRWAVGYYYEFDGRSFIHVVDPKPFGPAVEAVSVIPETVGQFTGLRDKGGREIFEGDVLKISGHNHGGYNTGYTETIVTVAFDRLCWSCGNGKSLYNYSTIEWASIEVAGTVHDAKKEG